MNCINRKQTKNYIYTWDYQAVFELLPFQMWKISQNLEKFLGTSLKTRIQQLITQVEFEKPG
jgi:hypothetical protein